LPLRLQFNDFNFVSVPPNSEGNNDTESIEGIEDHDDEDESGVSSCKKRKTGRTSWREEETEKIIEIMVEKHIVQKLDGKFGKLRHSDIYKSITVPLNASKVGCPQTVQQVKTKIKKLREMFYCVENTITKVAMTQRHARIMTN